MTGPGDDIHPHSATILAALGLRARAGLRVSAGIDETGHLVVLETVPAPDGGDVVVGLAIKSGRGWRLGCISCQAHVTEADGGTCLPCRIRDAGGAASPGEDPLARHGLQVAADVAGLLTSSGRERIGRQAAGGALFECPACGGPGTAGPGASVIILHSQDPLIAVPALAHRDCAPSGAYRASRATMVHPGPPASCYYWTIGHAGSPTAVILLDYADPVTVATSSGEETTLLFTGLLAAGMALIDSDAPALPPCGEFTAEIDGQAVIIDKGPALWFAGRLSPDMGPWADAAARHGEICLLICSSQVQDDHPIARYDAAVRAGRIAGARIAVTSS